MTYIEEDMMHSLSMEVSWVIQESQEKIGLKRKNKKCKLPQWDLEIKADWYQKPMSSIEALSYTISVFSDLLDPELAMCWSEHLGRQVELQEKLDIMSVTQ